MQAREVFRFRCTDVSEDDVRQVTVPLRGEVNRIFGAPELF
jgi:hypothetical protein